MAPKKLTDCPENLRESIDWLIQVRYGNGPNDKGLENLSQALKKLIEYAIKNAETSLDTRKKQLECPEKYYSNDYNSCYCKTKEAEIKEAKEAVENAKDSEKSKKEKELKKLQSEYDEHVNNDHSLSKEERENKIKEQNDNFTKLKDSLQAFIGKENNNGECEKILKNLCDGLETFLGFNKDSKGYTGQGIVYSDLDRLCDGVMAFLHGVLKGVRDEQPYSVGKTTLDDVISILRNSLCRGHEGFKDVIFQVSQGVGKYNAEVAGGNGRVRDAMVTLIGQIEKVNVTVKTWENNTKLYDVDRQLSECTGDIDMFAACMVTAKKNIDDLQPELRKKVKRVIKDVNYESNRVEKIHEHHKKDRDAIVKLVGEQLVLAKDSIIEKTSRKISEFVQSLNAKLEVVRSKLYQIDGLLTTYVSELREWIQKAEEILRGALGKIEDILGGVKDGHDKNTGELKRKTVITVKATEMQTKADKLHGAYEQARQDVGRLAGEALEKIKGLEDVYKEKLNTMKKHIDDKVGLATVAIEQLGTHFNRGLEQLGRTMIDPPIQDVIKTFQQAITLASSDVGDLGGISRLGAQQIAINFRKGLESNDNAPALLAWAKEAITEFIYALIPLDNLNNKGGPGKFEEFREFLTQLQTYRPTGGTLRGKTVFQALESDLKRNVKRVLQDVKVGANLFHVVFQDFHKQITKGHGVQTVHEKIAEISTQFKSDFTDGPNPQIIIHKVDADNKKRNALSDAINACGTAGFEQADNTINIAEKIAKNKTFKGLLDEITGELHRIAVFVSKGADDDQGVKERLQQLQRYIGKSVTTSRPTDGIKSKLEEMKNRLHALQSSELHPLIAKTDKIIKHSSEQQDKIVHELSQHVNTKIRQIQIIIEKFINNRYVLFLKSVFTAFFTKVAEELKPLPAHIDRDLTIGFKGFMKKLYDQFIDRVRKFYNKATGSTVEDKKFHEWVRTICYLFSDFMEVLYEQEDFKSDRIYVEPSRKAFQTMLNGLAHSQHFDYKFIENLNHFNNTLIKFKPHTFSTSCSLLLHTMRLGLNDLTKAVGSAYISTYCCETPQEADAGKYAKILVTVMPLLHDKCVYLYEKAIGSGIDKKIHATSDVDKNPLGVFFDQNGYKVATGDNKQDGELWNHRDKTGETIHSLLDVVIEGSDITMIMEGQRITDITVLHLNQYMYTVLGDYFCVCHLNIPKSKIYPCSIRDMLSWTCGLQYTGVVNELQSYCDALRQHDESYKNDDILRYMLKSTLSAHLSTTCTYAYYVLTAICGHGRGFERADYPYACNFCDNSRNFYYPPNVPELLDMLKDICTRLQRQLYFLYTRCRAKSRYHGWYDCPYGFDISGYQLHCNNQSSIKASCQTKSPLQTQLMDALPGFLPHDLRSVGCKSLCYTCAKSSPGQQCITPMGFWDLPTAASVTRQGSALHNVLARFCKDEDSPLCALLRCLMTISPHPPRCLGDMFAFYSNVTQNVNASNYGNDSEHKTKINSAIDDCFPLYPELHKNYDDSKLTDALRKLYCPGNDHNGDKNDSNHCCLKSLSTKPSSAIEQCFGNDVHCGAYLQPLGLHINHMYAPKHAAQYVSWFVYITWDFWKLFDNLRNAFERISCKSAGCSSCNCVTGNHGVGDVETSRTGCQCTSIVQCRGVMSTFYKYGFTFRVPKELMEGKTKRTCQDFTEQLNNVMTSKYFTTLFEEIDNFFFAIRMPFFHTLVALWLLSLLYLIHIMVIRLDLLHIKSHLRSPSSHRIAAQSLLAAGRVGRLAKLTYLQP